MKSYLRFLSRNKLYTAIEVVGLSLALAFLIILGSMLIEKSQVNDNIKDADEIYALVYTQYGNRLGQISVVGDLLPQIPQVKEWTVFAPEMEIPLFSEKGDRIIVSPMSVKPDFFTFFGLNFVAGNPETALKSQNAVVISRKLADALYPGEDPIGRSVGLEQMDLRSGTTFIIADSAPPTVVNNYIISGIIDGLGKNVLPETDIYMNYSEVRGVGSNYMFRTDSGKNVNDILQTIKSHPVTEEYFKSYLENTEIIEFESIKDGEIIAPGFRNISDPKTFKAFVIICIVVLSFSIFNYISLTLAFSRFRLKEAATRSLLGTSKSESVLRCVAEAFILVISSYILAMMLVIAFHNEMTSFFSIDINPLSNSAVFVATLTIAVVTGVIAGTVNSFMNRRYRPIDVIKGESRYQDKTLISKIFIGIQSCICMIVITIGSAIVLQTKKMTDYPVGFNTENIISVLGSEISFMKYKDDIKSLPFVENTGCAINDFTINTFPQVLEDHIYWCYLTCDKNAFDILGFKIKRLVESSGDSEWKGPKTYTTENSYELSKTLKGNWSNKFAAILEDFHLGSLKTIPKSSTMFDIIVKDTEDMPPPLVNHMLIKVSGDQNEAKEKIREYFIEKGVYHESMQIDTLEDKVLMNYTEELNMLKLVSVFASICILLTVLAIVALSSYFAQVKIHDTAVYKVFGMSSGETFLKTVWSFTAPLFAGTIVGIPFAWFFVSRWLESYPFRINNSPVIYIASLIAILAVTVASVVLQAIRLIRINPAEVLKKE